MNKWIASHTFESFLVHLKESFSSNDIIVRPLAEMVSKAFKGVFLMNPWTINRVRIEHETKKKRVEGPSK